MRRRRDHPRRYRWYSTRWTKLSSVEETLRLTRAMYRRVGGAAAFKRLEDAKLGEIWVLD